ncbi:FAD:protein FMN transferase [Isachenkonia alkalipeptolytica]|uniref:FAD:protein FMN transferase n=1 Tax=Isachenkonia alkalipeptolytica TaxID=2565777 RepID=A0AA43XNJ7_9CLOT|nr:FAD:protein FMN transferase [Isachenkonia alkalipeptolytica]NBG89599.1 FAD:protein FMN transferase [Isachenkonia alkalipeptolytica]
MKNIKVKRTVILLGILVSFLLLFGCSEEEDYQLVQESRFALGTYNQVTVYAPSEEEGQDIMDAVFTRVNEIENLMSINVEDSDISKLNEKAGESSVTVDPETFHLLDLGKEYKELTDGTFNIGIGTLIQLWDIGGDDQQVPEEAEIGSLLNHTDLNQLILNEDSYEARIEDPEMIVDLGGIAKGYAVDQAVQVIKNHGVEHAIVDFGGDVYVLGGNPDGNDWRIGISTPEIGESGVVGRLFSSDMSVVSSGDYERYFIENDQLYHHIIDPSTGHPTDNELSSVTVISDSALEGDILSTAMFVMGLEDGLDFVNDLEGVEAVLITKSKEVYLTTGVSDLFEIMDEEYTLAD